MKRTLVSILALLGFSPALVSASYAEIPAAKVGLLLFVTRGLRPSRRPFLQRSFRPHMRGVDWQDMNPAQTYASGFACVVKSLLAGQIRRKDIDSLSGGILSGDTWVWSNNRSSRARGAGTRE
ncbi:hypothetical protein [Tunturiibacter gelidiferens]|uniref:hypothetical protein n=1 Tax=Tunturiibacter gelidiferens TaxID=3069689 RepID=UPI003D9B746B